MATKKKSYYKPKGKKKQVTVDADLISQIRQQVLDELKSETTRQEAQAAKARTEGDAIRAKFVEEMKASPEPWVDILMWVNTPTGVKYELDWNQAFINNLEAQGIKGVDEEQTIQKWVAILVRSTADTMDEVLGSTEESKFE